MTEPMFLLRQIAAGQDSQFATAQALNLGVTANMLTGMRRRGETTKLRHGVARFASATGNPDPAITAALACWPSAVISHASAAAYHGLSRVAAPELPEITIPHGEVRRTSGVTLHWSRDLPPQDVLQVGRLRYTTFARTVLDLADCHDRWETLAVVDDAVAAGANRRWIHQRAKALAHGRNGVSLVRDATHPDAAAEFRSWLERAAAHLYRAGHLPDPEWNVRVRDHIGFIGVVDALWHPWRVIAEKEGLRFHTTPRQRRSDAQRFNRLQDAEYRPRRFTWEDVVHRPVEVVATLYRALNGAGANLDLARIPRHIEIPQQPFV